MSGVLQLLCSVGGDVISVDPSFQTMTSSKVAPTDAHAGFRLSSDGTYSTTTDGIYTVRGNWILPVGAGVNYSAKMTILSGAFDVGTVGSFLALSSDRTWQNDFLGNSGSSNGSARLDIAPTANTSLIVFTCTITLNADVSP